MRPLNRRGFLLATLGGLLTAGLIVAHWARIDQWLPGLTRMLGVSEPITAGLATMLVAGCGVFGLWGWFVARRFESLFLPRWPAILPTLFWTLALLPILVGVNFNGSDGFPVVDHDPLNARILEYLAMTSVGFTGLSILSAAWCAARGFRRDPVPVEDHFT